MLHGEPSPSLLRLPSSVGDVLPVHVDPISRLVALGLDEIPGASVLVFDHAMRYLLVRGSAVRDNGMDPDDIEGRLASRVLAPDRWARLEPVYADALAGRTSLIEVDSPDGRSRYLVRTGPIRGAAGEVIGGISIATDVTELRRAQSDREAGERRTRLTFESAPIGMALEDLHGCFLEVNDALCRMLDRDRAWLRGRPGADVIHPHDRAAAEADRVRVVRGEVDSARCEARMLRSDGAQVWVLRSMGLLTDDRGQPQHVVSHYVDVTETRGARERMAYLATHDGLTGLLNRDGFNQGLERIAGHAPRLGTTLAALFMDLDEFKAINDSFGHAGGDAVLATVAERIRESLRADDLVARFGGDEFVALLTSVRSEGDVDVVTRELHRAVGEPIRLVHGEVRVTLSIGVAIIEAEGHVEEALNRADAGMYRAKAEGGSRTWFTPRWYPRADLG